MRLHNRVTAKQTSSVYQQLPHILKCQLEGQEDQPETKDGCDQMELLTTWADHIDDASAVN